MVADESYADPTDDADEAMLDRAIEAAGRPPALELRTGVTAHPSGRVTPANVDEDPERTAVRRRPGPR